MFPKAFPFILILTIGMVGCFPDSKTPKPTPEPEQPVGISQQYKNSEELKPEVSPPKEANLVLNGTKIPVTLQEKREGNAITYTWIVDEGRETGEPVEVESEKYFFTGDLMSFSATAHEKYDPAINLIRYPLNVSDSWEWAGEVITGKTRNKATATITTQEDTLNLAGGKVSALLVLVKLNYTEIAAPGSRELKFWFKPGEGLIRRDLWASSTREPRDRVESVEEAPE